MVLPDHQIVKAIENNIIQISPFEKRNLQPASVDLTLHHLLKIRNKENGSPGHVDPYEMPDDLFIPLDLNDQYNKEWAINPGEFILGCTNEVIGIPAALAARVEGKSSLARIGLIIHHTGGWIDPGFQGRITLEICNCLDIPIVLTKYMPICQIAFHELRMPAEVPYGHEKLYSRYQGQMIPTPAKTKERYRED